MILKPFPHRLEVTIEDWFRWWTKYEQKGEKECWPWIACIMKEHGYGLFSLKSEAYISSRVSWFLNKKQDPGELLVLHECNNRKCVNPAHLSLGTHHENMLHMYASGVTNNKGVNNPCSRWNEEVIRDIRGSSLSHIEEAKKYGTTYGVIYKIRMGYSWKECIQASMKPIIVQGA